MYPNLSANKSSVSCLDATAGMQQVYTCTRACQPFIAPSVAVLPTSFLSTLSEPHLVHPVSALPHPCGPYLSVGRTTLASRRCRLPPLLPAQALGLHAAPLCASPPLIPCTVALVRVRGEEQGRVKGEGEEGLRDRKGMNEGIERQWESLTKTTGEKECNQIASCEIKYTKKSSSA